MKRYCKDENHCQVSVHADKFSLQIDCIIDILAGRNKQNVFAGKRSNRKRALYRLVIAYLPCLEQETLKNLSELIKCIILLIEIDLSNPIISLDLHFFIMVIHHLESVLVICRQHLQKKTVQNGFF